MNTFTRLLLVLLAVSSSAADTTEVLKLGKTHSYADGTRIIIILVCRFE